MNIPIMSTWEAVNDETRRLKVYGGWIVETVTLLHYEDPPTLTASAVFVPDAEHLWKIVKPKR